MEEDHDRAIVNEDTVEEENDILREENNILREENDILGEVLEEMQDKYEAVEGERDYAIDKQYLAEEEALIFLAGLQVCREEIEMLQEQVGQLQGAEVQ
jgi:regulator of replication initiation timing